jgi:hypothetical protein
MEYNTEDKYFEIYQRAMNESRTLGKYLNRVRELKSRADGLPYDEPITWQDICLEINRTWDVIYPDKTAEGRITPQSMSRWEKDGGLPSTFKQYQRLSLWFGPQVIEYAGINWKLARLAANDEDPNIAAIIDRAHDDADEVLKRGGERASRPAQAYAR